MNTSKPDYVARKKTKNVILRPQVSPKNPKKLGTTANKKSPIHYESATCQFEGCGERGIRTPGTSQYDGFQDRCNRPLCHLSLSVRGAKVRIIFLIANYLGRFFTFGHYTETSDTASSPSVGHATISIASNRSTACVISSSNLPWSLRKSDRPPEMFSYSSRLMASA